MLKRINCYKIFVGFESANQNILNISNKGARIDQSYRVLELLEKYGIDVLPSFLVGLEGENAKSIEETISFIKNIKDRFGIQEIGSSIVVPLPESRLFEKMLMHPILKRKYSQRDLFKLEELREDWINHFCEISYSDLIVAQQEIINLSDIPTGFGIPSAFKNKLTISSPGILKYNDRTTYNK